MNKDQVIGSATEAKGAVKEMAGKAIGDTKLESAGMIDRLWGRIQRIFGGLLGSARFF
ncbi:MAG: CsbD family protein [Alphaproteobacteria bacterium]|nr:MAG: CsbD family protein [Alphaproteobacteria bacterium]